jgi:hypothetical protein
VLGPFLQRAGRLLALLLPAECEAAAAAATGAIRSSGKPEEGGSVDMQQGPAAAVSWCWKGWQQGLLELLLLRQRTARYTHTMSDAQDEGAGVTWQAAERASVAELAVQRLRLAMAEQLGSYRQARAAEAKRQLVAAAAQQLLLHADSASAASAALEQMGHMQLQPMGGAASSNGTRQHSRGAATKAALADVKGPTATMLGQTVSLQRIDVPAIIEHLRAQGAAGVGGSDSSRSPTPSPKPKKARRGDYNSSPSKGGSSSRAKPVMLHALVLGNWCSQPPQALRRCAVVQKLCQGFGEHGKDLVSAINAQDVCKRPRGHCNAGGHTAGLPYPGPEGWTPEYAQARTTAVRGAPHVMRRKKKKVVNYLNQMQRYTAVAAWARQVAASAGDGGKQVAAVEGVLAGQMDANMLISMIVQVEGILGMHVPVAVLAV